MFMVFLQAGKAQANSFVEGDKITICGVRTSYKDSDQVGSAFFISKVTE